MTRADNAPVSPPEHGADDADPDRDRARQYVEHGRNKCPSKELALPPLLSGPNLHCLVVITVTLFSEALVTVFNEACILILPDKYFEVTLARLFARTTLPFA